MANTEASVSTSKGTYSSMVHTIDCQCLFFCVSKAVLAYIDIGKLEMLRGVGSSQNNSVSIESNTKKI